MSIIPSSVGDLEKLHLILRDIAQADPTVEINAGPSDEQTTISESHLAAICNQISNQFKFKIQVGTFEVIYLEAIRAHSEGKGKYIRPAGSSGNYGHCRIRISPNESGKGYEFTNETLDGTIPKEYVQSIDQGIQDAMKQGILAGYEMVDILVSLVEAEADNADSNEIAFRIAGSMAFKEAVRKARPVLLEPIMTVELTVPEDYIGATIADLNSRRGRIEAMEARAGSQAIKASVPLREILGYDAQLSAATRGAGTLSVQFSHYEEAPPRDSWGGEGPAVAANRPNHPRGPIDSAAARLDLDFDRL